MNRSRLSCLFAVCWAACVMMGPVAGHRASGAESGEQQAAATERKIEFNRDIRPILSENCYACHGPDAKHREADLRLDVEESAKADRGGYSVIVPGKSEESELYLRVSAADEEFRMPLASSGKSLTPEQIELFKKWIDQGAAWQGHWSLIPPKRPALPQVSDTAWARTPIDYFILARLEAEGLSPSEPADRRTLIRRVTFDLTGLPPEPEQVEAFVADTAPDAYEKLVDRLLRSPAYGEHMARYWLDAVRYGDTHGLHLDNYREMWPYRDWVIDAFNSNMPFDEFTLEQLAGDLLPDPTVAQQIASGFNRCNVTTSEGGSIEEEVYVRNVVDRVETTSTVFMGLTLGCAVCHDHKFDPFTQQDFYQLFAFFNSLDGKPLDGNKKDPPPVLHLPTPEQRKTLAKLDGELQSLTRHIEEREQQVRPVFEDWLVRAAMKPNELVHSGAGLIAAYPLDGSFENLIDPQRKATVEGETAWTEGRFSKGLEFGKDGSVTLGEVGRFERAQSFSFGAWIKTDTKLHGVVLARLDEEHGGRGYALRVAGPKVAVTLASDAEDNAIRISTKEDVLTADTWHHVLVTYDGSSKAAGVAVYVDGKPQPTEVEVDGLSATIVTDAPLRLGRGAEGASFAGGVIDDVQVYYRQLSAEEVASLVEADQIRGIIQTSSDARTKEQKQTLWKYYLSRLDRPYQQYAREKADFEKQRAGVETQVTTTLVFREREEPKPAYVLVRGQYDHKGKEVHRNTPATLPPMSADLPRDRLGLARWLLSPKHPLTARVTVNRFWQQCFGTGIVKTAEDFGSQGEWPSHPDLLDWLAVDFRESGWDVKRLMRMLVTSATYRQSSRVTPELLEKDPQNRLLARGPRFRLDAEVLRDQALAVSGLLVRRLGGPSVKPPQPAGLWEAVGYTGSNTVHFKQDTGPAIYRRSVYTFWKRTSPPPTMTVFDAPSREACRVRRERTNTPLQALVTMNEHQFFEAARSFAGQAMRLLRSSPDERARYLFQRATCRPPDREETEALVQLYQENLQQYQADPEAAKQLIAVGDTEPDASLKPSELAAWTMVANLVLNLDEVLTKN